MKNQRVPDNTNLSIWLQSSYQGLPVNTKHQLVEQYLQKLKTIIELSTCDYPRVFAVIVQLHCSYPTQELVTSNRVMGRFKDALTARIEAYRKRLSKQGDVADACQVRMAWGREQGGSHVPHFHVLLLFNRELFHSLGDINSGKGSLYDMIQGAWCSALKIPPVYGAGLVQVPDAAGYYLSRSDNYAQLPALFQRASYICKVDTKCFRQGLHSFGGSRR
jgi:hypothetical protein